MIKRQSRSGVSYSEIEKLANREEAELGVFVVTSPPTRGMLTEASRAEIYRHPFLDMEAPGLQIYEIQNYFRGVLPTLPFGERTVL